MQVPPPDDPSLRRAVTLRRVDGTAWEVQAGGRRALLLGTVQGLLEESRRVLRAFDAFSPTAVALGVSEEDLAWLGGEEPGWDEADWDMAPSEGGLLLQLGQFGEVAFPPPDLLAGLLEGKARGLPVYALDLPEEAFAQANLEFVETPALLRHALLTRRLVKEAPAAETAVDLCLAWAARLRAIPGYDELEREREGFMADRLLDLLEREARVLAVVDVSALAGVVAALREAPPDP
ncbi:MAG TPA: hypothetical protein VNZ52_05380 [Candidatus Thermoplasmatota archaeon]|nr:hypothetical protein [Candidatus Thermoplasmatota archaeon]